MKKRMAFCAMLVTILIGFHNNLSKAAVMMQLQDNEGKKLLKVFNATDKSENKVAYNWKGTWKSPARHYGGDLVIKKATAAKFEFVLNALNGANVGEISGTARIKGGKAFFDDANNKSDIEPSDCQLLFIHKSSFVDVSQTNGCSNYGGVGVNFAKEYFKGKQAAAKDETFDTEIFPNAGLERKFKILVGKDFENFLDAFHLIYLDEADLDNFGAKVVAGCVRGICPNMAGVIMFDKQERIWAAVMIEGGDKIHYYANDAAWTNKLPETIKNWLQEKGSIAPIVYKNQQSK